MPSKTVRFVNLQDNANEEWLKWNILQQVRPYGTIDQVYVRKCESLNLVYAYVIFELATDALKTVAAYADILTVDNKKLDVSLIGPEKIYKKYRPVKLFDEDYRVRNHVFSDIAADDPFKDWERRPFIPGLRRTAKNAPTMRGRQTSKTLSTVRNTAGTEPRPRFNVRDRNQRPI